MNQPSEKVKTQEVAVGDLIEAPGYGTFKDGPRRVVSIEPSQYGGIEPGSSASKEEMPYERGEGDAKELPMTLDIEVDGPEFTSPSAGKKNVLRLRYFGQFVNRAL